MRRAVTARDCIYRACRLMLMADRAERYEDILVYERLAQEWLTMAGRAAGKSEEAPLTLNRTAPAVAATAQGARSPRFRWRGFKSWFQ